MTFGPVDVQSRAGKLVRCHTLTGRFNAAFKNFMETSAMKRTALFLALAFAAPLAAQAADLSYSYLEAGYIYTDPDGADGDGGFAIRGSGAITDNWHVFGGYDDTDFDAFDFQSWRVGLGYNTPINDQIDFVGRIAYEKAEVDVDVSCQALGICDVLDDNGFSVEAGIRGEFAPNFEGHVAVRYIDIADDSTTGLALGAQYKFNQNWGIATDAFVSSDGNQFFIGPRLSF